MTSNDQKLQRFVDTIRALRGPNGCPWDRKQTSQTLASHLIAECQELVEAIEKNDPENICEEAGDLLYIILMLAEINRDQGHFSLGDVIDGVNGKFIRRHPHVFAGTTYENEEQLKEQWQAIKTEEKKR